MDMLISLIGGVFGLLYIIGLVILVLSPESIDSDSLRVVCAIIYFPFIIIMLLFKFLMNCIESILEVFKN